MPITWRPVRGLGMTPNLTTWIGFRYSRSKRGNSFSSLISIVSFMGLVLGVAALTVVVSVMNGFDRELHNKFAIKSTYIIHFSKI